MKLPPLQMRLVSEDLFRSHSEMKTRAMVPVCPAPPSGPQPKLYKCAKSPRPLPAPLRAEMEAEQTARKRLARVQSRISSITIKQASKRVAMQKAEAAKKAEQEGQTQHAMAALQAVWNGTVEEDPKDIRDPAAR